MNGGNLALSHGSLVVIKWIMCCLRDTVCLLEVWRETDVVPLGDKRGSWWMGDALNATGVKRPPWGPL
jgi:hypothetical protein